MSQVSASKVKTIAAIYVNEADGVLMIKPISESNQAIATSMIQCLDDTTAIRVCANGAISIRKIVEVLETIQEARQ